MLAHYRDMNFVRSPLMCDLCAINSGKCTLVVIPPIIKKKKKKKKAWQGKMGSYSGSVLWKDTSEVAFGRPLV